MPSADMDKLIERVTKLLALSKSSNENEAAVAMEKAQAILAEHNLTLEAVQEKANKVEHKVVHHRTFKLHPARPWLRMLANAVGMLYFCKNFFMSQKQGSHKYDWHFFVGKKHDALVASMMFEYLAATIQRLELEHADRLFTNNKKRHSAFRNAFRLECVERLQERIMERIEAAKRGEVHSVSNVRNLPALASMYLISLEQNKSYIEEMFGDLNVVQSRGRSQSETGRRLGREAGNKISLDAQLENKDPVKRITGL